MLLRSEILFLVYCLTSEGDPQESGAIFARLVPESRGKLLRHELNYELSLYLFPRIFDNGYTSKTNAAS